jgi:hypothetical protein
VKRHGMVSRAYMMMKPMMLMMVNRLRGGVMESPVEMVLLLKVGVQLGTLVQLAVVVVMVPCLEGSLNQLPQLWWW